MSMLVRLAMPLARKRDWACDLVAATDGSYIPRRLADSFPSPIFLQVVLSWLEATAGQEHCQTDESVQDCINEQPSVIC